MRWVVAILVSTAIWFATVLGAAVVISPGTIASTVNADSIAWTLFFAMVFWLPVLVILGVAAVLARLMGKTFVVRSFLFYGIAVLVCGSIVALFLSALPHRGDRYAFSDLFMKLLVPSLLGSLAFPFFLLRGSSSKAIK